MKNPESVSIRNLIITLITIICLLASVELVLSFKSKKNDLYDMFALENQNTLLLQLDHSPANKFFMSATNIYSAKTMFDFNFVPEEKNEYPSLDYLTKETSLDDAFNIVIIGDSFVWGAYSQNRNELFWRLLENDFRKDGCRVNIFGVGTTGANAYEELSWLTDSSLVEDLEPDMVIFGYVYNDSDDSVKIEGNSVNWNKELPIISTIGKILPNIYDGLIQRISAKTMYNDKYADSEYVNYDSAPPILKGRFYEKYKTDFVQKLDTFASTVDFPVAVVTLPTLPNNMMLEALYEPLEGLYSDCKNISYYNSVEEYNKFASHKHSKNYSVNPADFHPGSATNRFYADFIKAFIETDFSSHIESFKGKYAPSESLEINEFLPADISPVKTSENDNVVTYSIEYPGKETTKNSYGIEKHSNFLVAPLGKEHIRISFATPVSIDSMTVIGAYKSAELYYTRLDPELNYDTHEIYKYKQTEENTFSADKKEQITSILICADFEENSNRKINLTFRKSKAVS